MNDPLIACPKCGRTNPSDSTKCRYCGQSFATRLPRSLDRTDATTQLDFVANRSKRALIGVAATAVIVLIALVAFTVARTKANSGAAAIDPSAIRNPAVSIAGTNGAGDEASSSDIVAYVQFLQSVEQRRDDLRQGLVAATSQLTGISAPSVPGPNPPPPGAPPIFTPPTVTPPTMGAPGSQSSITPPTANSPAQTGALTTGSGDATAFAVYSQKWQDLLKDFGSQQWPKGCEILGNNYYRVLADYAAMTTEIENGTHTPDAVAKAESDTEAKVNADALAADQSLTQVCGSIGIAKNFSIAADLLPGAAPGATSGTSQPVAATTTQ